MDRMFQVKHVFLWEIQSKIWFNVLASPHAIYIFTWIWQQTVQRVWLCNKCSARVIAGTAIHSTPVLNVTIPRLTFAGAPELLILIFCGPYIDTCLYSFRKYFLKFSWSSKPRDFSLANHIQIPSGPCQTICQLDLLCNLCNYTRNSVCNQSIYIYIETSVRNKCRCSFYCALLTLHVSAPIGGHLQVVL
jgi:hypothetical protein